MDEKKRIENNTIFDEKKKFQFNSPSTSEKVEKQVVVSYSYIFNGKERCKSFPKEFFENDDVDEKDLFTLTQQLLEHFLFSILLDVFEYAELHNFDVAIYSKKKSAKFFSKIS